MPENSIQCPDRVPEDVTNQMERLAACWASSPARISPGKDALEQWDRFISAWVTDKSLPLLIRKGSGNRGMLLSHVSGRKLVPVDNSPAQWVYLEALSGRVHDVGEVISLLDDGSIPVAMVFKSVEKENAHYAGVLTPEKSLNQKGWKLAHIDGIGLRTRISIDQIPIADLESHFQKLMNPRNMFVVPLRWSGLGEIPEVLDAVRNYTRCH